MKNNYNTRLRLLVFTFLCSVLSWGQTTLVEWNFPNNPDNATVDLGIAVNLTKTISSNGGTSVVDYAATGATTNAANAQTWTTGSGAKWWEIEFETTGYGTITLSSKQRSSNTGPRDFKVQYKVGLAGTWTDVPVTVIVANDFTTGALTNVSIPGACDNQARVFFRWIMTSNTAVGGSAVAGTGTSRIDDISVKGTIISGCTSPTIQAALFTSSSISTTTATAGWTRGNGDNVLVVARSGGVVNADPVSGTTYIANSAFGSGAQIGIGNFVVYNGTGTSVNLITLTEGTTIILLFMNIIA